MWHEKVDVWTMFQEHQGISDVPQCTHWRWKTANGHYLALSLSAGKKTSIHQIKWVQECETYLISLLNIESFDLGMTHEKVDVWTIRILKHQAICDVPQCAEWRRKTANGHYFSLSLSAGKKASIRQQKGAQGWKRKTEMPLFFLHICSLSLCHVLSASEDWAANPILEHRVYTLQSVLTHFYFLYFQVCIQWMDLIGEIEKVLPSFFSFSEWREKGKKFEWFVEKDLLSTFFPPSLHHFFPGIDRFIDQIDRLSSTYYYYYCRD